MARDMIDNLMEFKAKMMDLPPNTFKTHIQNLATLPQDNGREVPWVTIKVFIDDFIVNETGG